MTTATETTRTGTSFYYPEMGEAKPEAEIEIEARMSHYGNHYFLTTKPGVILKGRGIVFRHTLTSEMLTPSAQYRVGYHEYKVTERAFEKIEKKLQRFVGTVAITIGPPAYWFRWRVSLPSENCRMKIDDKTQEIIEEIKAKGFDVLVSGDAVVIQVKKGLKAIASSADALRVAVEPLRRACREFARIALHHGEPNPTIALHHGEPDPTEDDDLCAEKETPPPLRGKFKAMDRPQNFSRPDAPWLPRRRQTRIGYKIRPIARRRHGRRGRLQKGFRKF